MDDDEMEPLRGLYDWGKAFQQNPDMPSQIHVIVPMEMLLKEHGDPSYGDTDTFWKIVV